MVFGFPEFDKAVEPNNPVDLEYFPIAVDVPDIVVPVDFAVGQLVFHFVLLVQATIICTTFSDNAWPLLHS